MEECILCKSKAVEKYYQDCIREYLLCTNCGLVFVPAEFWLDRDEEKSRYDWHENNDTPGYRKFLSRLFTPLRERLSPHSSGLDFGCGPGPLLAKMLNEAGHEVAKYDLFYYNQKELLKCQYDFICATEVVEHFQNPGKEISRLLKMLKPFGWLGIMTKLVENKEAFGDWHYIRDLTHISFFSKKALEYIAKKNSLKIEFIGKDVIFFQKNNS